MFIYLIPNTECNTEMISALASALFDVSDSFEIKVFPRLLSGLSNFRERKLRTP